MDIEQGDLVFSYLELFVGGKAVLANQAADGSGASAAPAVLWLLLQPKTTIAAVTTFDIKGPDTPTLGWAQCGNSWIVLPLIF